MNEDSPLLSRVRRWAAKKRAARGSPPERAIVVALMLAVTAFMTATVMGTLRLSDISLESRSLATNVMPSVIALTTIRERLGELVSDSSRAVDGVTSRPPDIDRIESEIASQSAAYESHATVAEREGWRRARGSMREALVNARRSRDALAAGRVDEARSLVDRFVLPSATAADVEIWKLVQSNAMAGERVAEQIDHVRRNATVLLFALDALCVALSIVLAGLALRAVSRHTKSIVDRSHELEQFAARVAHDIRGPLAPVMLVLQRLRKDSVEIGVSRSLIDTGLRAVRRAVSLVDDLLAFARAGGEPDLSARASVLETVRATFEESEARAKEERVELRLDPHSVDVAAACPPGVLTSIVSNLVHNAIKYMGQASERRVVVSTHALNGALRVDVIDSGPGLPRGSESRVFEPYVRADQSGRAGLGLGLATVKRLVEGYGGRVGVRSSSAGCAFWFELPAAPCTTREPEDGVASVIDRAQRQSSREEGVRVDRTRLCQRNPHRSPSSCATHRTK